MKCWKYLTVLILCLFFVGCGTGSQAVSTIAESPPVERIRGPRLLELDIKNGGEVVALEENRIYYTDKAAETEDYYCYDMATRETKKVGWQLRQIFSGAGVTDRVVVGDALYFYDYGDGCHFFYQLDFQKNSLTTERIDSFGSDGSCLVRVGDKLLIGKREKRERKEGGFYFREFIEEIDPCTGEGKKLVEYASTYCYQREKKTLYRSGEMLYGFTAAQDKLYVWVNKFVDRETTLYRTEGELHPYLFIYDLDGELQEICPLPEPEGESYDSAGYLEVMGDYIFLSGSMTDGILLEKGPDELRKIPMPETEERVQRISLVRGPVQHDTPYLFYKYHGKQLYWFDHSKGSFHQLSLELPGEGVAIETILRGKDGGLLLELQKEESNKVQYYYINLNDFPEESFQAGK